MNFIKRHPIFTTIMTAFALLILGEAWYMNVMRIEAAVAEQEVRQRIAEIEQLQRQKPAPIDENLRSARDEFAQNAEVLANMLRVLNVTGPDDLEFFQNEPGTRADAWFEISQFVERMTAEAAKSSVELKADERFGFSAFALQGPEPAYIRGIYRQHRIVEYLLGKLFAARPRALIAVQREAPQAASPVENAPAPAAAPASAARSSGASSAGELFVIDPQVSARTPGYVDTLAFRIIFSGHTTSLRGFLNALAAPEIPLVVRSVEVVESTASTGGTGGPARSPSGSAATGTSRPRNPFGGSPTAAGTAQPASQAAVPIVAENASVFTVTVELFDVKIRAPQVATMAPRP